MSLKIFKDIVSGWNNFVFPDPEIEKMAITRAEICSTCPHANPEHPFKKWTPEEKRIEPIKGLGCKLCGCPLSSKTRSPLSSCPIKKW